MAMTAILASWLASFLPYLVTGAAAVAGLWFTHSKGVQKGEAKANEVNAKVETARNEAALAEREKVQTNAITKATEVSNLNDADVDNSLRDKWNG